MIVDTHVHVVAADHGRYPLNPSGVGGEWFRERPVTAEELVALMDEAAVARAVLVQAFGAYGSDNRYVVDAARAHPGRFVSVAVVDPGDDPAMTLRQLAERDGVSGVRLFVIGNRSLTRLDDPRAFPVWDLAAELDVRVAVTILSPQLPELRAMLERYPEAAVALDHCGFPDVSNPPSFPGAAALFELAAFPNLHLKVSSIVLEAAAAGGGDPRDFVDRLADVFGADRLLWGSDFPQTHDRSYASLVELGRTASSRLAPDDQQAFLGLNALRLWPALGPAGE